MATEKMSLRSFMATAKKRNQVGAVRRASSNPVKEDWVIPTGSIELDYGLGGGLRVGWVTMFWGNKSGGKTTSALRTCGNAQDLCRNCFRQAKGVTSVPPSEEELSEDSNARWSATGECDCFSAGVYEPEDPSIDQLIGLGYIEGEKKPSKNSKAHKAGVSAWRDAMTANSYSELVVAWFDEEMTLDNGWAEKLGVDTNRLLLVWSNSAEEAIDIMAGLIFTAEVDLLVLDSIAQLTPKKELESSAEEWQQGLAARLMNKAIRRWNKEAVNIVRYHNRPVTQLWINQERVKIGVLFGSPATMPGGMGQGFQVVAEAKFRHGKTETIEDQYGEKKESTTIPVWEELVFKITKSKSGRGVGLRGVEGTYRQSMRDTDVYPAGTILDWERVYKMAMKHLVQQEKKGSASKYQLAGREYTTQAAILRDLRADGVLYEAVRKALLAIMRGEGGVIGGGED